MLNTSILFQAQCDQPIEQGVCSGSFERWGYDKERDACVPFNYGGCKGNKNNYATENSCDYHCKTPGIGKSEYSSVEFMFHVWFSEEDFRVLRVLFSVFLTNSEWD